MFLMFLVFSKINTIFKTGKLVRISSQWSAVGFMLKSLLVHYSPTKYKELFRKSFVNLHLFL